MKRMIVLVLFFLLAGSVFAASFIDPFKLDYTNNIFGFGDQMIRGSDFSGENITVSFINATNATILNLHPPSNNTGSIGLPHRIWANIYAQQINVSKLGAFSPITLGANLVGVSFNISADNFIGLGKFSNVTIEQNLTVLGSVRIRGKENLTLQGLHPCLEDGSFCQVNASSGAWNKTIGALVDPEFGIIDFISPNVPNFAHVGIGTTNATDIFTVVGHDILREINTSLNVSIISWYRMEENVTTVMLDSSKYGHHLNTFGDPSRIPSKLANGTGLNATRFDAINQFGKLTPNGDAELDIVGNMSWGGWIQSDGSGNVETIIRKFDTTLVIGWGLEKIASDRVSCVLGSKTAITAGAQKIDDGIWHHVFCVLDSSANTLKAYWDGSLASTTSGATQNNHTVDDPLFVASTGTDNFFNGDLDELLVYNITLSDAAVTKLFDDGPSTGLSLTNATVTGHTFIISPTGLVGIGVSSPTVSLDVDGDITATGTITAPAFVDLTAGWGESDLLAWQCLNNITSYYIGNTSYINHSSFKGACSWVLSGEGRDIGRMVSMEAAANKHSTSLHANPELTILGLGTMNPVGTLNPVSIGTMGTNYNFTNAGLLVNSSSGTGALGIDDNQIAVSSGFFLDAKGDILIRTGFPVVDRMLFDIPGVTIFDNLNVTGELNVTSHVLASEFRGPQNWTDNQNYPVACPAGGISTLGDSVTCTDFLLTTGDTATGNYTFDTSTLFIDSTNNKIGIGTISPTHTLHIKGDTNLSQNTYTNITSCSEALETDANGRIICGTDATGAGGGGSGAGWINTSTLVHLFSNTTNVSMGSILYVDTINNRIGLGNTQPSTMLEIEGTITSDDYLCETANCLSGTEIDEGTLVSGGEISGFLNNLVIGNDALDDQYYDSEADLTTLLDDNYAEDGINTDITGATGLTTQIKTSSYINYTMADGNIMSYSNGCSQKVNSTGVYFIC